MGKLQKKGIGKLAGTHTSFTPLALQVCKKLTKCDLVEKISSGHITGGLRSSNGKRNVKATKNDTGALFLAIRDNLTLQEIRVFGTNHAQICKELEQICRKLKIDFIEA